MWFNTHLSNTTLDREFDQTAKKKAKAPVPDSKERDNTGRKWPKIEESHFHSIARVLLWDVVVGGRKNATKLYVPASTMPKAVQWVTRTDQ